MCYLSLCTNDNNICVYDMFGKYGYYMGGLKLFK